MDKIVDRGKNKNYSINNKYIYEVEAFLYSAHLQPAAAFPLSKWLSSPEEASRTCWEENRKQFSPRSSSLVLLYVITWMNEIYQIINVWKQTLGGKDSDHRFV